MSFLPMGQFHEVRDGKTNTAVRGLETADEFIENIPLYMFNNQLTSTDILNFFQQDMMYYRKEESGRYLREQVTKYFTTKYRVEILVGQRNSRWTNNIGEELTKGSTFFLFGIWSFSWN